MATGYKKDDPLVPKEDRSNDMFPCGFGDPQLLPLKTIGEEAKGIAKQIVAENSSMKTLRQKPNKFPAGGQGQPQIHGGLIVTSQDLDKWCDHV